MCGASALPCSLQAKYSSLELSLTSVHFHFWKFHLDHSTQHPLTCIVSACYRLYRSVGPDFNRDEYLSEETFKQKKSSCEDINAGVRMSGQIRKLGTAGQEEGRTPAWGASPRRGCWALTARMGRGLCWSTPPHARLGKRGPLKAPASPPPDFQNHYCHVKEGKKVLNAVTRPAGALNDLPWNGRSARSPR